MVPANRTRNPVATAFGIELQKARAHAKLTQQVVAERANVDPVFISFLENGHRQPSLTVLLAIERALSVRPGELARRVASRIAATKKTSIRKKT